MTAVAIVGIVFTFVTIISIVGIFKESQDKREKLKIKTEAALRMMGMEKGIKPGTYSEWNTRKEDPEFRKAMDNLKQRVENLDTILKGEGK